MTQKQLANNLSKKENYLFNELIKMARRRKQDYEWTENRSLGILEPEDLAQEFLLMLLQSPTKMSELDESRPNYFLALAKNQIYDICRKYGRRSLSTTLLDETLAKEEPTSSQSDVYSIELALPGLPDRQRLILSMIYGLDGVDRKKIREIAAELRLTRQTICSEKKKGLEAIKRGVRIH